MNTTSAVFHQLAFFIQEPGQAISGKNAVLTDVLEKLLYRFDQICLEVQWLRKVALIV